MKNDINLILARAEEVGDCLEWPGATSSPPQVRIEPALPKRPGKSNRSPFNVRRGIWETQRGDSAPDDYVIWAKCFNAKCIKPEHIRCTDRTAQMRAAFRAGCYELDAAKHARIAVARRRQPNIKLSEAKAAEIRASTERPEVLALRYDVDKSLINRIKAGKAWAPVTSGYSIFTALAA